MAPGLRAFGLLVWASCFGSAARFDAVLSDLCTDFLNSGVSQQIIDNCIALGVPADGSFQQVNPQISVSTGGNQGPAAGNLGKLYPGFRLQARAGSTI